MPRLWAREVLPRRLTVPSPVGGPGYGPGMASRRGKVDNPDGIITAQLQGTAGRRARQDPLARDPRVCAQREPSAHRGVDLLSGAGSW